MTRIIDWTPDAESIGGACVAIGVFDGVHLGHQALLTETVNTARTRDAMAAAVTFDRDPEQVLVPEQHVPQLLSLTDKCHFISLTGIDVIFVIPFTPELAGLAPEAFLDAIVGGCCDVRSIHVGADFRFGTRASGDLDTLYVWGVEHNADVSGTDLLEAAGAPVTATRIRALIAAGDLDGANALLGRPHTIRGRVHSGRGEGVGLGFPTANLSPLEHAAIPIDGVYAGLARLEDGTAWPAAISVGVPPTFPQALDSLEVHVIGYSGRLVGQQMRVDFLEYVRPQRAFGSLPELTAAIAADVSRIRVITDGARVEPSFDESDIPTVDDPLALEAAERFVAGLDRDADDASKYRPDWIAVYGPARVSALLTDGGSAAALLTGPLEAAGIPFAWDPLPPAEVQSARPDFNWMRAFTLYVPPEHEADAREILGT